jgi:hypothetical protein
MKKATREKKKWCESSRLASQRQDGFGTIIYMKQIVIKNKKKLGCTSRLFMKTQKELFLENIFVNNTIF